MKKLRFEDYTIALWILIILMAMLSSCSSKSKQAIQREKTVRVQRLFITTGGILRLDYTTHLTLVDSLYRIGDTIDIGEATFVIVK